MPWPVYTETFVRSTAQGVWVAYTVPPARRAVVKSVTLVNGAGQAGECAVRVGGVQILYHQFQAANGFVSLGLTAVGYAGQTVESYASPAGCHQTVSGYLFGEATVLRSGQPPTEEFPFEGLVEVL